MKVYLWQNSIKFSRLVKEQLPIFLSCLSPEQVKKLQKFINFCLKVGHKANLKISQSTWRHMWLLWNVQIQHIMEWERSATVVVLISGTFVQSRLIYDKCLVYIWVTHLHIVVPTITCSLCYAESTSSKRYHTKRCNTSKYHTKSKQQRDRT